MKRILVLAAALLILAAGCNKQKKTPAPAPEAPAAEAVDMSQYMPDLALGTEAPDFEAPDIAGQPVRLNDFRGNYVVLDYWATWCKDCRAEVPAMKELYATYAPKGVQFVGVSFDTDKQALTDYCVEHEIAWLQLCNGIKMKENPISTAFDLHWIPTMFLLDPDGKIAGIAFTAAALQALLEAQDDLR